MTGREIVNYDKAYAEAAEEYAKQDRGGGGRSFGTRGGILAVDGEELPGNQVAAVIIDSYLENAFYEEKYDPDMPMPPNCYAFTRGEPKLMVPHLESMSKDQDYFMPQNIDADGNIGGCDGCPKNVFGSADKGKGKACKNIARLSLLVAGLYSQSRPGAAWELKPFENEDHYRSSELYGLKLPVTSVAAYEKYRKMLLVQHQRPPFGALTRIFLVPHATYQFTVNFELVELLPSELAAAVLDRNAIAKSEAFKGYEVPREDERPAQSSVGRFGGARRR